MRVVLSSRAHTATSASQPAARPDLRGPPPEVAVSEALVVQSASITGGTCDVATCTVVVPRQRGAEMAIPIRVVSVECRARRASRHTRAAPGELARSILAPQISARPSRSALSDLQRAKGARGRSCYRTCYSAQVAGRPPAPSVRWHALKTQDALATLARSPCMRTAAHPNGGVRMCHVLTQLAGFRHVGGP